MSKARKTAEQRWRELPAKTRRAVILHTENGGNGESIAIPDSEWDRGFAAAAAVLRDAARGRK